MTIYADSSFFVSVYIPDQHSAEAIRRMSTRPRIWFTPFHKLEFAHAVARGVFYRLISAATADAVQKDLERDCRAGLWELADFPFAAFETGVVLARRHVATLGTRTLDSLHVACALELKADRFWTFDDRQAKLAKAAGLKAT